MLLSHLKRSNPQLKTVSFFSDGAASQFKQRFLFHSLIFLRDEHDIDVPWHFFATSHGKGVVDGIRGTVKRAVWRACLSGTVINSAEKFLRVATSRVKNVIFFFIKSEDTAGNEEMPNTRWTELVHYLVLIQHIVWSP